MKILSFCWNSNGINLCETISNAEKEKSRTGVKGVFTQNCDLPDFLPDFINLFSREKTEKEKNENPKTRTETKLPVIDIVCIGFENDPNTGTYFHSNLLPTRMKDIGYKQVYRDTKIGGKIDTNGYEPGALRLSVYVKNNIKISEINKKSSNCWKGTGAISSTFKANGEKITIINCLIPFNAESIKLSKLKKDPIIRQDSLNMSNICFNGIIRDMVHKENPNHVIIMGDLNYRIEPLSITADIMSKCPNFNDKECIKEYFKFDELHQQMRKNNIYTYLEGENGEGPTFPPVCNINNKFIKDSITPSWCNRILYKSNKMKCCTYDNFNFGEVIHKSKNSAVYAIFSTDGDCEPKIPPRG